jgi:hypothetical protein
MIKKIIILSIFILFMFSFQNIVTAKCKYDNSIDVKINLGDCELWKKLVEPWNVDIGGWQFKNSILIWVKNIAWFLGLVSVSALVYAAFMMTISGWEEEKIKKAKDIIKWTILWFLWIVLAGSLITIIVKFMYDLW